MNILNFTNYTKDLHMSKCRTKSPREGSAINQTSDLVSLSPVKKTMLTPHPHPHRRLLGEVCPPAFMCLQIAWSPHFPSSPWENHCSGEAVHRRLVSGRGEWGADLNGAWLPGKERSVGVGSTGWGQTQDTRDSRPDRQYVKNAPE